MYRIFLFFVMFAVAPIANADVYVIYNNNSKEVLSVSSQDDAVVPSNCSKEILRGDIKDYPLEYQVSDYRIINKSFVVNTTKISERESRIESAIEKQGELDMVDKEAQRTAYDALIKAGYTFKHVKETDFQ